MKPARKIGRLPQIFGEADAKLSKRDQDKKRRQEEATEEKKVKVYNEELEFTIVNGNFYYWKVFSWNIIITVTHLSGTG